MASGTPLLPCLRGNWNGDVRTRDKRNQTGAPVPAAAMDLDRVFSPAYGGSADFQFHAGEANLERVHPVGSDCARLVRFRTRTSLMPI
jgi:hypothetical protein